MRLLSLSRSLTLAATGLALLGGVLAQSPAAHADDWCWDDPVIQVNNTQVAVNVGLEGSAAAIQQIVNDVHITVYVPSHASARVLAQTHNSLHEQVTFVQGDPNRTGDIAVTFDMAPGHGQQQAGMQVTEHGQTSTTYGKAKKGLTAHVSFQ